VVWLTGGRSHPMASPLKNWKAYKFKTDIQNQKSVLKIEIEIEKIENR